MKKITILYLLLIIATGCKVSKVNNKTESLPEETLHINGISNDETKIIFLTISITQADSVRDTYNFKVTNTMLAEGQIKKNSMATFEPEPNFLYCEILDADNKTTDYIRVQNPLLKVYEFNATPESPLQKKTFKSKQGEFNLRFQFDKNSKYLSIYKATPDSKTLKRVYHATILP